MAHEIERTRTLNEEDSLPILQTKISVVQLSSSEEDTGESDDDEFDVKDALSEATSVETNPDMDALLEFSTFEDDESTVHSVHSTGSSVYSEYTDNSTVNSIVSGRSGANSVVSNKSADWGDGCFPDTELKFCGVVF
mmetsp:Transcript_19256/g.32004  ORF Transcript_19256/g.32004 Transcript_19256/m.32004 type:complete len:137 (-) Transcript_19256:696-1106(-)